MIRILSLAAALAILPLSAAVAADEPQTSAEAAIEAAAEAFQARMETMSDRAEEISEDESLTPEQRSAALEALQAEYQPEIAAFTADITAKAAQIAQEALAGIDVNAIVQEAMNDPEVKASIEQGIAAGTGIARNSAWTNPDPEQLRTYGLVAQYALDQAADAVEDADDAAEADDGADVEEDDDTHAEHAPAPHAH
jgi:hypothetical protein